MCSSSVLLYFWRLYCGIFMRDYIICELNRSFSDIGSGCVSTVYGVEYLSRLWFCVLGGWLRCWSFNSYLS